MAFVLTILTIIIIYILLSVFGPLIAFIIGAGGMGNFLKGCFGIIIMLAVIAFICRGIYYGWNLILK